MRQIYQKFLQPYEDYETDRLRREAQGPASQALITAAATEPAAAAEQAATTPAAGARPAAAAAAAAPAAPAPPKQADTAEQPKRSKKEQAAARRAANKKAAAKRRSLEAEEMDYEEMDDDEEEKPAKKKKKKVGRIMLWRLLCILTIPPLPPVIAQFLAPRQPWHAFRVPHREQHHAACVCCHSSQAVHQRSPQHSSASPKIPSRQRLWLLTLPQPPTRSSSSSSQ